MSIAENDTGGEIENALGSARAVLERYETVSAIGYGAGDHQLLAAALRTLIAEVDRVHAPTKTILAEGFVRATESAPIHWAGDAPTSLHGNGAASFKRTTRDADKVTCRLCLTLLARPAVDLEGSD